MEPFDVSEVGAVIKRIGRGSSKDVGLLVTLGLVGRLVAIRSVGDGLLDGMEVNGDSMLRLACDSSRVACWWKRLLASSMLWKSRAGSWDGAGLLAEALCGAATVVCSLAGVCMCERGAAAGKECESVPLMEPLTRE